MDAAGNLYGVAYDDGAYDNGSGLQVKSFRKRLDLYRRSTTLPEAATDVAPMAVCYSMPIGNLYGTAGAGGQYGYGVVWEITP